MDAESRLILSTSPDAMDARPSVATDGPRDEGALVRVLLVEDEPDHRELILRAFGPFAASMRVTTATSLSEARACLKEFSPDLVITDLMLPDGRGLELLRNVNGEARFPVLMMTGFGNEQMAVEALKSGALDYIVKSRTTFAEMPHIAVRVLSEWRRRADREARVLEKRRDELEELVRERTADLLDANQQLRSEIAIRQAAENTLKQREQFLSRVFNSIRDGMCVVDRKLTIIRTNETLDQWFTPGESLVGKKCYEMFHGRSDPCEECLCRQTVRTGKPATQTKVIASQDGQRWLEISSFPLIDTERGEVTGAIEHIRDITERKRAEEVLRETEEALGRSERLASIGTLAAGIAHEINNPLNSIGFFAEAGLLALEHSKKSRDQDAALQNTQNDPDLDAVLQSIQDEALRCGRIVQSVLQFSRSEVPRKWNCDLNDIAQRAWDMMRQAAADREVAVSLELTDIAAPAHINPTEIEQVFVNLIANAIQVSEPGGTVLVSVRPTADHVEVLIRDWGCGMTKAQIGRVFDPFFTTRQHEGGTGLGLSISYGIVEQHGGTLDVESEPGEGTTFRFTLPMNSPAEEGAKHG